ncbi:MAG: alpha/beta hydrolase family protein [Planctomycetota bacterium]
MTAIEQFELAVDDGQVTGALHRPAGPCPDTGWPTVLLCGGYPMESDDFQALLEQVTTALVDSDLAAATFAPRLSSWDGDDRDAVNGARTVDDASAVYRWLALRDDVDLDRIGVLGYSSAGIVAACLAGRTDRLACLCLLAAATVESIAEHNVPEPEVPEAFLESLQKLDPVLHVAIHDCPTLIVHGASDQEVSAENALVYLQRIQNAGHHARHVLIARADHGFTSVEPRLACMDQLMSFFVEMPSLTARNGGG